jgi:hypothetical protein
MKVPLILSGLLCASILLLAQDVKYNFDPSVNFAKYHTYQWAKLPTNHPDQLIDRQIMGDIDSALAAKGLTKVTSNPDIVVGYQIAVDQEKQWDTWGGGAFYFGGGFGTATESTINIGTLGIDFFDPASKNIVWRGTGTKTIDPSGNAEKNMERMQKAVDKILKHYPPGKK